MEDNPAELFAEAQARAREQAAYEQLKASGMQNPCLMYHHCGYLVDSFSQLPCIPWQHIFFSYGRELKYVNTLRIQGLAVLKKEVECRFNKHSRVIGTFFLLFSRSFYHHCAQFGQANHRSQRKSWMK